MPATKQPVWEFVSNLGDKWYLESGGIFIYRDKTGVYEPEAEILELTHEDIHGDDTLNQYTVYRFILDRWKIVNGYLVPFSYDSNYPHPINRYEAWFKGDLGRVADCMGTTLEDMREQLCSDNPCNRAFAYMAIGNYHGLENLDEYPIKLNYEEAKERYKDIKGD